MFPEPIGWAPQQLLNGGFSGGDGGGGGLASAIDELRMQQMMMGQEPIPELAPGQDPKEYLQLLGPHDFQTASTLAAAAGLDLPTVMQEASDAGYYDRGEVRGGLPGLLDRTIGSRGLGSNIPALAQLTMLAGGGLAGAAAAGLYGGGAAAGSGTGTASSSFTNAGYAGGLGQGGQDMAAVLGGSQAGQDMAAVIGGAGGGAGAASGLGGLGLGGWLTVGALGAQALQGNKDIVTNSSNEPPAYLQPYLTGAAGQASQLYGQGNYVAPVQQAAIDYGTNVLSGNYLNANPYLDATFNKAAGAVTNQVQSNFGLSGRNARGIDAAGFAQEGYNDLATQIYGGNYQAERARQQQIVPYAGQLGSYTNPGQSLDDYIARLRNLGGGYGSTTSSTPTESNWLSGLAGLGLTLMRPGG